MGRLARQIEPILRNIKGDIWAFCRVMNFTPTWQQAELLAIVQHERRLHSRLRKKRIAVKSGQGPGKTTATVIAALWLVLQEVDSLVIVTAPTMRQCKDVWMAEARRLLEKANPMIQAVIEITGTRLEVANRREWGIWTATSTRPENMQGYHQKNLTFIVDEASGVDRPIIEQIKGTLSNENSLLLMIGNPNTQDCGFYDCFTKDASRWYNLTWNAEEVPENHPDFTGIMQRNAMIATEYGKDSDMYRVRVRGEFPHSDPNCIIAMADLLKCAENSVVDAARRVSEHSVPKAISYDFARLGGDECVVYRRSGLAIVEWKAFTKQEPVIAVRTGFKMQHEAGWRNNECLHIADATGIGQGVLSHFYEANKNVLEFHNHGTPSSRDYADKITEAWFSFARLVKQNKVAIPNDSRLLQQLSTRQYTFNKKGQLMVESKTDYKDRGHDSPDRADAMVMVFYDQAIGHGQVSAITSNIPRIGSSLKG